MRADSKDVVPIALGVRAQPAIPFTKLRLLCNDSMPSVDGDNEGK
jgi:hypothetical protein